MSDTGVHQAGRLVTTTPMRAAIARRMSLSKKEVPHVYFEVEILVDAALDRLDAINTESDVKVTVSSLFVRATALALRDHPEFNAHWTAEGLLQLLDVNIAVAVAVEGGLIAPVLVGADTRSVVETAGVLRELVGRAREGGLRSQEVTGGSFTLSNLGMFDVTSFYGIITPPQVGILTVGKTSERLKLVGRRVAAERVVVVALSADHRAVDGADAAHFLGTIKSLLENPELLEAPVSDR